MLQSGVECSQNGAEIATAGGRVLCPLLFDSEGTRGSLYLGPMETFGVMEGPDLGKLRAHYVRRKL